MSSDQGFRNRSVFENINIEVHPGASLINLSRAAMVFVGLSLGQSGLEMNRANRAPSSSKCNSLMHKNIHFGFNWCVASHLCSTQINSKLSKSRKFVCYESLLKFFDLQFLFSVYVWGHFSSRSASILGS